MRIVFLIRIAAFALLLTASSAQAYLRAPQVAIQGTGLQELLTTRGQAINVNTQQQNAQTFAGLYLTQPPLFFLASTEVGEAELALYNAGAPGPPLYTILPAMVSPGWYSEAGFLGYDSNLTVNLFDPQHSLVGTTIYSVLNAFNLGFAVTDAHGTFYSEDAVNAGGQPRLLYFQGTGAHTYDAWLAAELDGDGDFDDALFLLGYFAPVPVERMNWGALKRKFR